MRPATFSTGLLQETVGGEDEIRQWGTPVSVSHVGLLDPVAKQDDEPVKEDGHLGALETGRRPGAVGFGRHHHESISPNHDGPLHRD